MPAAGLLADHFLIDTTGDAGLFVSDGQTGDSSAGCNPVAATIDATRVGPPITKLLFGGFMEPATTFVWAEMLADRKFYAEISSKPPAVPTGGFGRRGPQRRWVPVGPDEWSW